MRSTPLPPNHPNTSFNSIKREFDITAQTTAIKDR